MWPTSQQQLLQLREGKEHSSQTPTQNYGSTAIIETAICFVPVGQNLHVCRHTYGQIHMHMFIHTDTYLITHIDNF